MLHADFMPRADETALEKREGAFDRVRMDVSTDVLASTVIDRLMLRDSGLFHGGRIGLKFVRKHDFHFVIVHILLDVLAERFGAHVTGLEQPKLAAALTDADDDLLVFGAASALAALHFAAYVGLIHFDYARKFGLLAVRCRHSLTDTHTEIPRGLVGHAEGTFHLQGRHPFLRFAHEEYGYEPFRQRQMGVVEDRIDRDSKLLLAAFATEHGLSGTDTGDVRTLALWALRAFGPTQFFQVLTAFVVCVVAHKQVTQKHGGLRCQN